MSEPPPPAEGPAVERPKKKRKKPAAAEPASERVQSPELDRLIAAFDAGNYALVRREAPRLVQATEDDAVRAAARDLLRRIDPDPISKWIMVGAGLLLAFLAGWYWTHAQGGP